MFRFRTNHCDNCKCLFNADLQTCPNCGKPKGKETMQSIMEWHRATFPHATLEGQLAKYQEEQEEWIKSEHKDLYELADMFIVACGIARFDIREGLFYMYDVYDWFDSTNGIEFEQLEKAIYKKMKKNRKREWNENNGYYKHKA